MANGDAPNQLVTEDFAILSAFLSIMRSHISTWPKQGADGAPVYGRSANSANQAFTLAGQVWKSAQTKVLGIIIDAEDRFDSHWGMVKKFATDRSINVPALMPASGFIGADLSGKVFGAWIMPDNKSSGMLETFCRSLVTSKHGALWDLAREVSVNAKSNGAPFKDVHQEKADLHTLLAWLDPPGSRIGESITSGDLDPRASSAIAFVDWCKTLYGL